MNQTAQEIHTETRPLICKLTDQEIQELGQELSEMVIEFTKKELEKKEVAKSYNDVLSNMMAMIKKRSYLIDRGEEERDISCRIDWNHPVAGKKRVVRQDSYESWVEDMTPDEMNLFTQPEIDFTTAKNSTSWGYEEE